MIKGYRKSASAAKAEGSARSAGEKNLTVKVDVAYPLMNDVRSDNFTIKVEPPEEPLDAPTLKLSINFEAEESLAEVMEFSKNSEGVKLKSAANNAGLIYAKDTRLQLLTGSGSAAICVCNGGNAVPEWSSGEGSSVFGVKSRQFGCFEISECY